MSLRDELDVINSERQKREAQKLSDEEVYQILLNAMYQEWIIDVIKRGVSSGETIIKGSFGLSYATNRLDKDIMDRLSGESRVYKMVSGYDDPDGCKFFDLYTQTVRRGFFKNNVDINLTPLGERVYSDLKRLAGKDQISLSEPYPDVDYHYLVGSMKVDFEYRY